MPLTNYIQDQNKFKLSGPPSWWLTKLNDFDPSLVVVPSRQGFFYRLAQRRKLTLPEHIVNESLFKESDTQMLAAYSLVPVTTIMATARWDNPLMWQDLADRAPWRNGGADKVNAHIEDMERTQALKVKATNDQLLTDVSRFGWRMLQRKTGQRIGMSSQKPRESGIILASK